MKNAHKPRPAMRLPYRVQAVKYVARQLKVSAKEAMEWLKKWHVDDHVRM